LSPGDKVVISTPLNKVLDVTFAHPVRNGTSVAGATVSISLLVKAQPNHRLEKRQLTVANNEQDVAEQWVTTVMNRAYAGMFRSQAMLICRISFFIDHQVYLDVERFDY
jgi:hypothetical protein